MNHVKLTIVFTVLFSFTTLANEDELPTSETRDISEKIDSQTPERKRPALVPPAAPRKRKREGDDNQQRPVRPRLELVTRNLNLDFEQAAEIEQEERDRAAEDEQRRLISEALAILTQRVRNHPYTSCGESFITSRFFGF